MSRWNPLKNPHKTIPPSNTLMRPGCRRWWFVRYMVRKPHITIFTTGKYTVLIRGLVLCRNSYRCRRMMASILWRRISLFPRDSDEDFFESGLVPVLCQNVAGDL